MSDPDPEQGQPSLELPSLGGWRRRRRGQRPTEQPVEQDVEPPVEPPPPPPPAPEPVPSSGEQATVVLPETAEPEEPRAPWIRRPSGLPAVALVGAAVGLVLVGLTWASLRICEQVQDTPSCGTAGYLMLAVVLAAAVVVGSLLLRLALVPDPVSTSFLGVGLATVLALLLLVDWLDQPAMIAVIPLLVAASYAAASWVTTTFVEPGERTR